MSEPRIADARQRRFEKAERLAMRLYNEACSAEIDAELAKQTADAKAWWIVRQAAAEAVSSIKAARGAPAPDPTPPKRIPGTPPTGPLDFDGVPEKPCG